MVKVPMIIVHGNRSSRYPAATVERLNKEFPQLPRFVVNSEHDVAGQAPDALIGHVRKFVAGS